MGCSGHLFFEGVAARSGDLPPSEAPQAHPRRRPAEAGAALDEFYVWLFGRAGLPVEQYRPASLSRRLAACLRAVGAGSTAEARKAIEADPALLRPALSAVLLGVTKFCRDRSVFEALEHQVLPGLLKHSRTIRVWSAACSEGQELYSVAVLLAEAGRLGQCRLLGTDCRAEAIDRASCGIFAAETVKDFNPLWRSRYFTAEGGSCRMSRTLRSSVRWKVADLFAGAEPGPWDLVLWRNMAIYLKTDAAEDIWRAIVRELRPGGYLITGKADHPPSGIGLRRLEGCVYQWS
jgi:chemotaxis methyl-accepting protein methylase